MSPRRLNKRPRARPWLIPDWMRPYVQYIVNTGGNDVEDMINGHADPLINLPLSTLQACVKSQVMLLEQLHHDKKLAG